MKQLADRSPGPRPQSRMTTGPRAGLALLLSLLLSMLVAGTVVAKPKKSKGKTAAKPAAVRPEPLPPSGPNFLLDDWFFALREETRSHSEGRANSGAVGNSTELPLDGRSWRIIASARGRGTNFGVDGIVRLLERTADALAEAHPGTLVEVGNIGLAAGGRIIQSKSHQAGRDVDVALFALDRKGRPARLNRFVAFDGRGKGTGGFVLDVERTWDFVALMLQSEEPVVQWMFVSGPIRELLLEHARARKADPALIQRAAEALRQPSDSTPHNDHFHIRIHCSDWDRLHGCEDYGPARAGVRRDARLLQERLETLSRRVRKGLPRERLLAMDQLARLQPVEPTPALLEELLCDSEPGFRERALRLLRRTAPDRLPDAAIKALGCAPDVAAACFLFDAVSDLRRPSVYKAAENLASGSCGSEDKRSLCLPALAALSHCADLSSAPFLASYLDSSDKAVRDAALRSLRLLVAARQPPARNDGKPEDGEAKKGGGKAGTKKGGGKAGTKKGSHGKAKAAGATPADWKAYAARIKGQPWDSVVRRNLVSAGFKLQSPLAAPANARELLRALRSGAPASTAAQIALFQALSLPAPSFLEEAEAVRVLSARVKSQAAKSTSRDSTGKAPADKAEEEAGDGGKAPADKAEEEAGDDDKAVAGKAEEEASESVDGPGGGRKESPALPQLPL
ncbi:MAG: hypothetical protein FJ109_00875 [Deltaproteobacteria bacterium]|nr:hypothetical protein [Deltaproteobacteria bacterium]